MKNYLYILLLAIVVSCWGCSGGGEDVPTPTPEEKPKVEVITTAPVLTQEGGNSTVTFTSTDSWTIEPSDDIWVARTFNSSKGKVGCINGAPLSSRGFAIRPVFVE